MGIPEFLEESIRLHAMKPAVIHGDRQLSYADLGDRSDALACALVRAGVQTGDRVALCINNSIEYIIAYFGILKAGAVIVPLNMQLVARELGVLLQDCSPHTVVTESSCHESLRKAIDALPEKPCILVVSVVIAQPFERAMLKPVSVLADNLAMILYTSGTTGKPKGVMLSHANLIANAESIIDYLGLTAFDRMMVVLPFYYSYGNSLLTTHIKVGATMIIDNRFLYPNAVLATMQKEEVTAFAGVPSHYAILLRKSAFRSYTWPHLRYVTQAGGAMSPEMIREFKQILPRTSFYVMYGQTEATARLSYLPPELLDMKFGSIGIAIPGVELKVLSEGGIPVQPGEVGEIVARGKNVMAGYWDAPDESSQVLRNGWLYTGDLARCDSEGFLYIVSRKKDMIKSGAHRISPLEIEDVVNRMPCVLESAAVGIPDALLGETITLFVVLSEQPGTVESILEACGKNLAPYKVPKQIKIVSALPRTSSGKIKREELKKGQQ